MQLPSAEISNGFKIRCRDFGILDFGIILWVLEYRGTPKEHVAMFFLVWGTRSRFEFSLLNMIACLSCLCFATPVVGQQSSNLSPTVPGSEVTTPQSDRAKQAGTRPA